MNVRALVLTSALLFAGAAVSFAQSPMMGTWKLNEAKSHIPAGAVKNQTVVYESQGDNLKVTTDGTAGDGSTPIHTEWTGKIDGKDYPATGSPTEDTRTTSNAGQLLSLPVASPSEFGPAARTSPFESRNTTPVRWDVTDTAPIASRRSCRRRPATSCLSSLSNTCSGAPETP